MPQTLSDADVEAIAQRTAEHMSSEYKQLWIDRETHYSDHTWIAEERKRREEVAQFRRKVASSMTIWALILVAGFVATSTWKAVVTLVKFD